MRVQWIDAKYHFLLVAVAVWVCNKMLSLHTTHTTHTICIRQAYIGTQSHTVGVALLPCNDLMRGLSVASRRRFCVNSLWFGCGLLEEIKPERVGESQIARNQAREGTQETDGVKPFLQFSGYYANVCVAFKLVSVGRISSHNMCGRPNGHRTAHNINAVDELN